MKKLNFSYNWNNKLNCKCFTTLRLSNDYNIGEIIDVYEKNNLINCAKIIGKKELLLKNINEYIARIDTGYSEKECKDILIKMYKNRKVNWNTQKIYFYLVIYLNK